MFCITEIALKIPQSAICPYFRRKKTVFYINASSNNDNFIMLKANAHEHTRNEQGLFTYLYHWLVVTDQSTLRDIEDIVGNITHLSAISWETQQNGMVRCHMLIPFSCKLTNSQPSPPSHPQYISSKADVLHLMDGEIWSFVPQLKLLGSISCLKCMEVCLVFPKQPRTQKWHICQPLIPLPQVTVVFHKQ